MPHALCLGRTRRHPSAPHRPKPNALSQPCRAVIQAMSGGSIPRRAPNWNQPARTIASASAPPETATISPAVRSSKVPARMTPSTPTPIAAVVRVATPSASTSEPPVGPRLSAMPTATPQKPTASPAASPAPARRERPPEEASPDEDEGARVVEVRRREKRHEARVPGVDARAREHQPDGPARQRRPAQGEGGLGGVEAGRLPLAEGLARSPHRERDGRQQPDRRQSACEQPPRHEQRPGGADHPRNQQPRRRREDARGRGERRGHAGRQEQGDQCQRRQQHEVRRLLGRPRVGGEREEQQAQPRDHAGECDAGEALGEERHGGRGEGAHGTPTRRARSRDAAR